MILYRNGILGSTTPIPSPDGKYAAAPGGHNTVVVYDWLSGQEWARYYGHQDGVYGRRGTVCSIVWEGEGTIRSESTTGSIQRWSRNGIHLSTPRPADPG